MPVFPVGPTTSMAIENPLVRDLVQAVRRELFGMHRPEYNELADDINTDITTINMAIGFTNISVGSLIAIDSELMYVWAVVGNELTVRREMLGSVGAFHDAGALVEVNPRFPDFQIRDALRAEIRSWPPRLFAVTTVDATAASGQRDVNLDYPSTDLLEVLEVQRSPKGNDSVWYAVNFRLGRNLDTADYPSGLALVLDHVPEKVIDLRVTYAYSFDTDSFEDDTDLLSIGVTSSQHDVAILGAVWRLVISREIKRNFNESQGDPRSAQEVPPGAIANSGRVIKALRDERLREEMNRLRAMWPYRRR